MTKLIFMNAVTITFLVHCYFTVKATLALFIFYKFTFHGVFTKTIQTYLCSEQKLRIIIWVSHNFLNYQLSLHFSFSLFMTEEDFQDGYNHNYALNIISVGV